MEEAREHRTDLSCLVPPVRGSSRSGGERASTPQRPCCWSEDETRWRYVSVCASTVSCADGGGLATGQAEMKRARTYPDGELELTSQTRSRGLLVDTPQSSRERSQALVTSSGSRREGRLGCLSKEDGDGWQPKDDSNRTRWGKARLWGNPRSPARQIFTRLQPHTTHLHCHKEGHSRVYTERTESIGTKVTSRSCAC
jgi:hypothetical protein